MPSTPVPASNRKKENERYIGVTFHFRSDGVWVMPTSRPSGPSRRVTIWPQGSVRIATSRCVAL